MTGRFDALVAWVWQPVKWRICPQKWDFQGRWILLPLRFEAFRYELHQVLDWILKHQLLASRRCNTCRGLPSWTNGNCLDYCIRWTLETLLRFYFRKHSTACDGVFDHWCFHRWCILACRQILYVHRRPVVLPRTDALGISVCFCWAFRGVYFCRNLYTIHMIVISQKKSGKILRRSYLRQSVIQLGCPVEILCSVLVGRNAYAFWSRTVMGFPGSVRMMK